MFCTPCVRVMMICATAGALMMTNMLAGNLVMAESSMLYFVTGKGPKGSGIYRAAFDSKTGKFGTLELAIKTKATSSLAFSPKGDVVYTCGRSDLSNQPEGVVAAFGIDEGGVMSALGELPTGGNGPCYVETTSDGLFGLAANYGGGSVAAFSIAEDGSLDQRIFFEKYTHASGVVKDRQGEAHAHQFREIPGTDVLIVNDLGADQIRLYDLNREQQTVTPHALPMIQAQPGDGPRHVDFLKVGGKLVGYVLNELANTVTSYYVDDEGPHVLQTVELLPDDFTDFSKAAEVRVHPSKKFLYATNRGLETVVAFQIGSNTGLLELVEREPTGGKHCRHVQFDPTGNFLIVANQEGGPIVVMSINPEDGSLTATGETLALDGVPCTRFRPQ